jgi:hypothetical protein
MSAAHGLSADSWLPPHMQEFHFESTMGRKVRVGQRDYRHTGRAGDLSLRYGPTSRPEDEPSYFKS